MPLSIETTGELFQHVQLQNVLGDGKTFPDCLPKFSLDEIVKRFNEQKGKKDFQLRQFVLDHFNLPLTPASDFKSDRNQEAREHIHKLWDMLTRQPSAENSSLISLPKPYVVPGGRFREIYYWDSYFTMLGLKISGKQKLIEDMINNFSYLIDQIGYIPNGNRTYFIGRSQPPFFSLMVKLLSEIKSDDALTKYLPQLEKEYTFWMNGVEQTELGAKNRVVRLHDQVVLNRYWDANDTPRSESYKEDVELSHHSSQVPAVLFRHLRAAAESGWDFSCRWFADKKDFKTIQTTDILPVDLNCLLYHLEKTIADANRHAGNREVMSRYTELAEKRKQAIRQFCWSESEKFFVDYDHVQRKQRAFLSLAGVFPLFFQIATPDQALAVANRLERQFLKPGGLTTTLEFSGQQWDAPNGWAPLQWISYQGLLNYGLDELAMEIKNRWIRSNESVFAKTGKMTEKYDVWNDNAEASGGEYPNQDGFGWTNGVYLAMKEK